MSQVSQASAPVVVVVVVVVVRRDHEVRENSVPYGSFDYDYDNDNDYCAGFDRGDHDWAV